MSSPPPELVFRTGLAKAYLSSTLIITMISESLCSSRKTGIGPTEDYQFHQPSQDSIGIVSPGKAGLTILIHSDLDVQELDIILGRKEKTGLWNTLSDALDQMGILPDEVAKKFGLN